MLYPHSYKKTIFKLFIIIVLLFIFTFIVTAAEDEEEILKPTIRIYDLSYEDMEDSYRGLFFQWTIEKEYEGEKKFIEATFIDPKVKLLSYKTKNDEITEEAFNSFIEEINKFYSEHYLFEVRVKHLEDKAELNLKDWEVFVKNNINKRIEPVEIKMVGEPEFKYSSKGSFWEQKYQIYFPARTNNNEKFISDQTEWMELCFEKDNKSYKLKWQFSPAKNNIISRVHFELYIKIGLLIVLFLLIMALMVTRPRKHVDL